MESLTLQAETLRQALAEDLLHATDRIDELSRRAERIGGETGLLVDRAGVAQGVLSEHAAKIQHEVENKLRTLQHQVGELGVRLGKMVEAAVDAGRTIDRRLRDSMRTDRPPSG